MKRAIGIILLVALNFAFIADESIIQWNKKHRLSWKDFKGEPDDSSDIAAITASGISYDLAATIIGKKVHVDCKVSANFYPEKSWYKKELADSIVLAHEQLHFDITELHARKFREAIKKTTFTENVKQEMKALYDKINHELDAYQNKYDAATDYSRNIEKQTEWGKKIKKELEHW